MPEEHDPMGSITPKTGTVNYIGPPIKDGFEESGIISGIVLKVRVLNDENI